LADESGLAAVSMRQVAGKLGTGPASLYRYVAGRDDLLDLMADAMAGEIDLGVPLAGDPVSDLVELAARTRTVHLRHPWLLDLPPEQLRLGPRGLAYLEHALRAMSPASLPGQAGLEAVALLNSLVTQLVRAELQAQRTHTERQSAQAAYLAGVVSEGRHPFIAEAMADAAAAGSSEDPQAMFERRVRWVVSGLIG
jgi:AcrR family transcriptional regulator